LEFGLGWDARGGGPTKKHIGYPTQKNYLIGNAPKILASKCESQNLTADPILTILTTSPNNRLDDLS